MRKYWKKGKVTIIAALWHKVITIPESKLLAWTEQLISFIFMSNYSYQLSHELFEDSSYSREREREVGWSSVYTVSHEWESPRLKPSQQRQTWAHQKKNRSSRSEVMQMHAVKALKIYFILFNELTLRIAACGEIF